MIDDAKPEGGLDDESWMDEMGWGEDSATEPTPFCNWVRLGALPSAETGPERRRRRQMAPHWRLLTAPGCSGSGLRTWCWRAWRACFTRRSPWTRHR